MLDFTDRLVAFMATADLTVADTARLFDRERRTVSEWTRGRFPTGARAKEAFTRLRQLEKLAKVKNLSCFPVPLRLSKRDRVEYVKLVGEGEIERARLLAKGPASG